MNKYVSILNDQGYDYLGGYVNSDSRMSIRCRKCGTERLISGDYLSRTTTTNRVICQHCRALEIEEKKRQEEITKRRKREAYALKEIKYEQREPLLLICEECGEMFFSLNKVRYCSTTCQSREGRKAHWENRRALKRKALVDRDITLDKLIERENNVCYLCGGLCDSNDYTIKGDTFIAGNNYPSIEHVVPLSKGGLHSWNNVRLAHRLCNIKKSDGGYISPFTQNA